MRATVLVIDDEPLILKAISNILSTDYDVTCEASSLAALDRFRMGERFDVVLCDLMMPKVTGIDVHDSLLEIAPEQARSMLFLTGGAFTARAHAFVKRMPHSMIEKPFSHATLLSRVNRALGR